MKFPEFFEEESFVSELKADIKKISYFSIEKGIEIKLNGVILEKKELFFSMISQSHIF